MTSRSEDADAQASKPLYSEERQPMNEIRFRPVEPSDADALLAMARAFHEEDGHPLSDDGEAAIRQLADGDPCARGWLVLGDDDIVGYVVVSLGFSVEYGGRDGFVDDLYLSPAARGRGVGRRVMNFAIVEAAKLGVRALHLEVERDNDRARRLYDSLDFRDSGRTLMSRRLG